MAILNRNNNALLGVEQRQQNTLYRYLQANSVSDGARPKEAQGISDWSLVLFAIRPIGRLRAISHAFLVFFFSAAELLPDVHLQYWIDFHALDPSLYPTHASMTLITSLVSFLVYFNTIVILSPRISIGLYKILVQTLAGSTLGFFERSNEGHLLNLFSEDTLTISKGLPRSLLRIMYAGFAALLMVYIVLSGANYIVFSLPLVCALIVFRARRFCSEWRDVRQLDNQNKTALCKFFEESSTGLTRLSIFYPSRQRQERGLNVVAQSQISFGRKLATTKRLRRFTDVLGTGLVVIVSASALFSRGSSTASAVGLAYHVAISFPRILYEAILAFANLDTSLDAVRRLLEFQLQAPLERVESQVEIPQSWPSSGIIDLRNASVYYTPAVDTTPAISSISLYISSGQHIGITGRLGSGKSSLVLMMLGFVRYEGIAKIDGIEISSVAPQILRSRLITIGKEPVLFEGSVRTNLLPFTMNDGLQNRDPTTSARSDAELEILLKRLHIWMPLVGKGGLDAIVDDIGYPQAEAQLLCIVRAILRQRETGAKVVLVDDATSCLNEEEEKLANDLMRESFQHCTVLRLSSRQSGLEGASPVLHLRQGEIVSPSRMSHDSDSDEE